MEGHHNAGNGVFINIPVLLLTVVVTSYQGSLWAVAQKAGGYSLIFSIQLYAYNYMLISGSGLMDLYVVTDFLCGF